MNKLELFSCDTVPRKVRKLADSDSDNDDTALSWVKKVRKKENDKALAAKRAQLLEEMDEEFGVGELVENAMGNRPKVL
jgi:U4/U6.U5 tri-snRNP-associated protein 1